MRNIINKEGIKNFLIEGSTTLLEKKIVVIFKDSKQKNNVIDSVTEEIRRNPQFIVNRKSPLVFKNNFLRVNNYSLFCGLPINEKFLVGSYFKNDIYYYEETE